MSDLETKLAEWRTVGLISEDQLALIRAHEGGEAPADEEDGASTGVSASIEAVGYLGGALALAAAFFFVSGIIPNLSEAAQVALAGLLTVVFFAAGGFVRESSPPGRRLKSVLWAAAVVGMAVTAGLVAHGLFEAEPATVVFSAFVSASVVAGLTWLRTKSAIGNVMLLLAIIGSAASLLAVLNDDTLAAFFGVAVWAVGVAWAILSWAGYTPPARAGMVAGAAAAVIAANLIATEPFRAPGLTVAVVTVALILISGARLGRTGLLVVGAIGAVEFSVQVAQELFGSGVGVAVALVVMAALLVIGAVAASRRRKGEVLQ